MPDKNTSAIRIPGLSKLDYFELRDKFPDLEIRFENNFQQGEKHGELGTIATITLTILGLKFLTSWLLKNRVDARIKKTVELIDQFGNKRVETRLLNLWLFSGIFFMLLLCLIF